MVRFILLAAGALFLDQWSKWLVMSRLAKGQSVSLVDNIFHLTYVSNPGAAFGILPFRTEFFIIVTVLVLAGIILFFRFIPEGRVLIKYGLALQLGGGAGNFIDRLRFGQVIDFFDFGGWPVFNVADTAIVIGVGLLVFELFRSDRSTSKTGEMFSREEPSDS